METRISRLLLAAIRAEVARSPAAEVCGLLFGTADAITSFAACANVCQRPEDSFELDPQALFAAHRAARAGGPRIVGHYHSHPNGRAAPSSRDAEAAMGDGALWLILTEDEARLWRTNRPKGFESVGILITD